MGFQALPFSASLLAAWRSERFPTMASLLAAGHGRELMG